MFPISSNQRNVIQSPVNQKIWLEGRAGTGKTTVGVERMLFLMASGIPGTLFWFSHSDKLHTGCAEYSRSGCGWNAIIYFIGH
jgi:hypothetical protein